MSELAIHGGEPVRTRPFPPRPGLGRAERQAVKAVLGDGVLSGFIAESGDGFLGGPRVRALEKAWADRFQIPHAVSMNSATSALHAAVVAVGVRPGDEVIVTPYSMSASATCVLMAGATPVFVDIEPETMGLDPRSVVRAITKRTKAVVVVDLFGAPAQLRDLQTVCAEHDLMLIEDASQAPGAVLDNDWAGTWGHVGVFSLNYHKTIQCGEGGVAVAHRSDLAERLRLVRNHGETVAITDSDIVGSNYRMGEIEAAIAKVQLGRLEELTAPRVRYAKILDDCLDGLPGVVPPPRPSSRRTSVHYLYAVRLESRKLGIGRSEFAAALRAEGVPVSEGYVKPLYNLPVFRSYRPRNCPVVEKMNQYVILTHPFIHAGMGEDDVRDIANAFEKVYARRRDL